LVVTHDPLLAALVGDELLYLDRVETRFVPLLSDWRGPVGADDGERLARARASIERAVLERAQAEELSALGQTVAEHLREAGYGRRLGWLLGRLGRFLTAPGRVLRDLLAVLAKLPESVAHPRDFGRLSWHALRLTGYSGLPFYGLVAAIFSATFLSIAFAAAELVSPRVIVENLRGDFILALTPPLCGFLFAARSGSALTAWLGGLALRRQTDALRSLGVSIDSYLRVPAFFGSFVGFLLTTFVFGAAMYWSATVTAIGFDVPQAGELLRETGPSFRLQLIEKTLLYGVIVGIIGTHMGLLPKRRSGDVAKSITRTIILCTLAIVISELFFAIDLHG
jgi:phospholipid/cholesterol/gamma-HCH transport system permease protein